MPLEEIEARKDNTQLDRGEIYIRHTLKDKNLFLESSLIKMPLGNGVALITGRLIVDPEGMRVPQAIEFDKALWGVDDVRRWISEHRDSFKNEVTKKSFAELFAIPNVQIFAAGTWNGDSYSTKDLDEMVKAFDENKSRFKPFLKLGHDDDQKLLQSDGLPAAGWINSIYRRGNKLFADFIDIPKKIFELIKNKSYRKVSCEIYSGVKVGDKLYKKMISAVSLLGADHPAVDSLDDILSMFSFQNWESVKNYSGQKEINGNIKSYSIDLSNGGTKMPEKTEEQIKLEYDLKAIAEKLERSVKDFESLKKEHEDMSAEHVELKKDADAKRKELSDAQEAIRLKDLDVQIAEMEKVGFCLPSMKPFIKELLDADKKTYTIDKDTFTKAELLKHVFKLFKAGAVNLNERTAEGDKDEDKTSALDEKIQKYAMDNKVSYSKAYRAVLAKQ